MHTHACIGYRHTQILSNLKKEASAFVATSVNPENNLMHEESLIGKY